MKFNDISTPLITFLVLAILPVCCSSPDDQANNALQGTAGKDNKEPVRIIKLEYQEIGRSVNYPVNLMAYPEVHLAPATPDRIERIHVEAGDEVREGELLVEMDRTQLFQAEVELDNMEKEYRRMDTLRKIGSITQQQYDQTRASFEVIRSNVEYLRENIRLTAPFSGKISARYFEDGEMYTATPVTPGGQAAILSILRNDPLKAEIGISERFIPYIRTGMQVKLTTDVYPDEEFTAAIRRINPAIDPQFRSFTIELEIPNPGNMLRPGMLTRSTVEYERTEALVAPAIAILRQEGTNERYIFIEEDGVARRVSVKLGERYNDMIEIISDEIEEGDHLIIAGQARLVDGDEVEVDE